VNPFARTAYVVAAAAALFAQAAPASAEFSYLTPAQKRAHECQQTRRAGDWAQSLPICLSAAAMFKALGDRERRNPWYSYEVQGEMMEAAAADYAGLGRHREAYDTAVDARRLLAYLPTAYKMDPDDVADIAAAVGRLDALIAVERRKT
jgi:hypothetical protein